MADMINLRLARKQAKRRQAEQDAAQRRPIPGRSRTERALRRAQSEKAERELDRHRLEDEDDS